jgi:cold shock CspA family protein
VSTRQATVSHFDDATHVGAVVYDDGEVAAFDAQAFVRGGLRLLRPGQRVRVELSAGEIVGVTIVTLRLPDLDG